MLSLARAALDDYELPPITCVRPIQLTNNWTFEVTTDGAVELPHSEPVSRFALRMHRPRYRSVGHTRSEQQFVRALHEQAIGSRMHVPWPMATRDGALLTEITVPTDLADPHGPTETRHCDLLTWIEGNRLVPGAGLGLRGVHQLGRALADVHNFSARFEPTDGFELPRWDADGMFTVSGSPFRPELDLHEILEPEDLGFFEEIADRVRTLFETLDAAGETFGVIHVDYILGNCYLIRRPHGWDTAVFDFDDCGWGYYLYDLVPLLGNLVGYPGAIPDNPRFPSLRRAFLEGYRTGRPVPVEWEDHLPLLMAARNLNHCLTTARYDVSPTPKEDAAWRVDLARRCLALASGR